MQEYDTRGEAKKLAEYITPLKLRQFLASKITKDNLTILEPAIGSGQQERSNMSITETSF